MTRRAQFLLAGPRIEIPHEALWRATHQLPSFSALGQSVDTDVAIAGAGISGLIAAVILARAGRRVVVVERDRPQVDDARLARRPQAARS